ncbi:hypothetical protein GBF38_005393 [Nibea albiflora]|uniref:Uncharacterized protein n=1 Tax=Nibea albiflora TaxID=240163 RepID=A0ACB7EVN9_NIBAL|nr:hypothetical protein GBF38_005393 [Nibea albiflora]
MVGTNSPTQDSETESDTEEEPIHHRPLAHGLRHLSGKERRMLKTRRSEASDEGTDESCDQEIGDDEFRRWDEFTDTDRKPRVDTEEEPISPPSSKPTSSDT